MSVSTAVVEYSNQRHNASVWTKYLVPLRYRPFFTIFTSAVLLIIAIVLLSISLPIRRCRNCITYGNDEIQDDVNAQHTNDDDTREIYIKYKVSYVIGVVLLVLSVGVVVMGITFTLVVSPFLCLFDCIFAVDDDLEANNGATGVCCSEGWAYAALPRRDSSNHKFVINRDEWGWRGNCISSELSAIILYGRLAVVAIFHGILQFSYYYNQPFQRAKFIDKSKIGEFSFYFGSLIGAGMYSLYQVLMLPYLISLDLMYTPNSDLLIATNNFTSYLSIRRPLGAAIMVVRVFILGHCPCLRHTIYNINSETSYISNSTKTVQKFSSKSADSDSGESALYTAIKLNLNFVIVFLVTYGANTSNKYRKYLMRLLKNKNTSMAQLLIKKYITTSELVNKRDKDGNTLLTAACTEQLHNLATLLVLLGGDLYVKNNQNLCPLDYVTDKNAAARLEECTVLPIACMYGKVERVRSIMDASSGDAFRKLAVKCLGDDARTCIHCVIERGNNDILSMFLEHGICDNTILDVADSKGFTPLLLACSTSNSFAIRQLIPKKVNVLVCNKNSNYCLHYTVKNNLVEGTRLLLRELQAQGVRNIDFLNKKLQSPLHIACTNNNMEILGLLLDFQPDLNIQDSVGNTPLHYCKDAEVLGALLGSNETNCSSRNHAGYSVAGFYCCANNIALLETLGSLKPSALLEVQHEMDQTGKAVLDYLDSDSRQRLDILLSTVATKPSTDRVVADKAIAMPVATDTPTDILDQKIEESELFKYKDKENSTGKIVPL